MTNSGHRGAEFDQLLDILGEPAIAAEPGEGSLDDPASRQQVESRGVARAFDDLEAEPLLRGGAGSLVALIATVGVDQGQPGEAATNAAAANRSGNPKWMRSGSCRCSDLTLDKQILSEAARGNF